MKEGKWSEKEKKVKGLILFFSPFTFYIFKI